VTIGGLRAENLLPNPAMSPRSFLPLLLALPLTFTAFADEKPAEETFIDPDKAGPDFTVQGEYSGEKCGAQVIALGGGKFHIVGWSKGLPGVA
jgi:hypothetical protein